MFSHEKYEVLQKIEQNLIALEREAKRLSRTKLDAFHDVISGFRKLDSLLKRLDDDDPRFIAQLISYGPKLKHFRHAIFHILEMLQRELISEEELRDEEKEDIKIEIKEKDPIKKLKDILKVEEDIGATIEEVKITQQELVRELNDYVDMLKNSSAKVVAPDSIKAEIADASNHVIKHISIFMDIITAEIHDLLQEKRIASYEEDALRRIQEESRK